MKKNILVLALAVILGFTATATEPIDGEKREVKTDESTVTWKAYKVTGSHTGIVNLKEGALMFDEGKLKGGNFTVDMTTLVNSDLEGEYKGKLEGHLKSDDFFAAETYTTAIFAIKNAELINADAGHYVITGNISILRS